MVRRRRHKALSYILSVVMMTLVTTSLASVVLLWGLGQTAESQSSFSLAIEARKDKAQERLVVENVNFTASGNGGVIVTIRNIGKVQIVIDQVYANHSQLTVPSKLVLGVQKNGNITATFDSPSLSAGTYYFIVATSRGTTYANYYTYST